MAVPPPRPPIAPGTPSRASSTVIARGSTRRRAARTRFATRCSCRLEQGKRERREHQPRHRQGRVRNSANAAEFLLLSTRLGDERVRLLEIADRLYVLEKDHATDTATFVLERAQAGRADLAPPEPDRGAERRRGAARRWVCRAVCVGTDAPLAHLMPVRSILAAALVSAGFVLAVTTGSKTVMLIIAAVVAAGAFAMMLTTRPRESVTMLFVAGAFLLDFSPLPVYRYFLLSDLLLLLACLIQWRIDRSLVVYVPALWIGLSVAYLGALLLSFGAAQDFSGLSTWPTSRS